MPRRGGFRVGLSLPRRWIGELMRLARGVPLIVVERRMDLRALAEARAALPAPPSWAAVFVKAYALVAARHPELRRAYMAWPWGHLYQAERSVAAVTVEREYGGESAVFFAFVTAPDEQPLDQLHARLVDFKEKPVQELRHFRKLIRYARLPWPVRPLLWSVGFHRSGRSRAKAFGTFGLTVTAGLGATLEQLVSPLTTTLTYGPIAADGAVSVRLVFDHRVVDGAPAARVLRDLEEVLTGELARELWKYPSPVPA